MGRFYRAVLEKRDTARSVPYYLVVFSVQVFLLPICDGEIIYISSWCKFPNGVILTYLATMNGIAFILRISKDLGPYIGNTPGIRMVADNTYSIMRHHYFGFFLVSCLFAAIASLDPVAARFNYTAFYGSMYFYYPQNLICWALLYCVAGVVFSILVHYTWDKIRSKLMNAFTR